MLLQKAGCAVFGTALVLLHFIYEATLAAAVHPMPCMPPLSGRPNTPALLLTTRVQPLAHPIPPQTHPTLQLMQPATPPWLRPTCASCRLMRSLLGVLTRGGTLRPQMTPMHLQQQPTCFTRPSALSTPALQGSPTEVPCVAETHANTQRVASWCCCVGANTCARSFLDVRCCLLPV